MEKFDSIEEMREPSGAFEGLCQDDKKNDTDYYMLPAWFYPWSDESLLDYPASHPTQEDIESHSRSGELRSLQPAFVHHSPELPTEDYDANGVLSVSNVIKNQASSSPPLFRNDQFFSLENSIEVNDFPGPVDTSPLRSISIGFQMAPTDLPTIDTTAAPVSSVTESQVYTNPSFDQNDEMPVQDSSSRDDLPGSVDTAPPPAQVASGSSFHIAYGKPFTVTAPTPVSSAPTKSARTKRYYKSKLNYQCPMCDKTFRSMSAQSVHMRSHTGERPFTCDICDQKFLRKHNLTAHMRVHDPSSQFSCPRCNMSFRHKNDRDIHVISSTCTRWTRHILDSPNEFACVTCSGSFKDRNTLLNHVRQHNRGLAVACPVCSIPFTGMKGHAIVKHVRSTHPNYMASLNLD